MGLLLAPRKLADELGCEHEQRNADQLDVDDLNAVMAPAYPI